MLAKKGTPKKGSECSQGETTRSTPVVMTRNAAYHRRLLKLFILLKTVSLRT
jgi:hypothetical protein